MRLDGEPATANAGRPSAFNDKIARELVRLLGNSVSRRTACLKCGIGLTTLKEWLVAGKDPESPLHDFRLEVLEAEAEAEIAVVEHIQERATEDAWVGMAWLKQRYPNRFDPKQRVEMSGDPKRPLIPESKPDLSKLSTEQVRELLATARAIKKNAGKA